MPLPDAILLEFEPTAGAQLYRYRADGEFCGDTWHETIEDAKYQAGTEYGPALGAWESVPVDQSDGHEYLLQFARREDA